MVIKQRLQQLALHKQSLRLTCAQQRLALTQEQTMGRWLGGACTLSGGLFRLLRYGLAWYGQTRLLRRLAQCLPAPSTRVKRLLRLISLVAPAMWGLRSPPSLRERVQGAYQRLRAGFWNTAD